MKVYNNLLFLILDQSSSASHFRYGPIFEPQINRVNLKIIYTLYYNFYRLLIFVGEEITPRYSAVLLLSILLILNFITAVVLIMILSRSIIIVNLPKIFLFLIGLT